MAGAESGNESGNELDVVAVGHAIVDVIASATDEELVAQGMVKGTMVLVDGKQAAALYDAMGPAVEVSGGSAANTAAGVASFGGSAAFIGKVRDDTLGQVFTHDIRSIGVAFTTPPAPAGEPGEATARCLVLVTPDAQRTMSTYLGAASLLGPDDIDEGLIARAAVTYLEGYLWDPPDAISALRRAMAAAHAAGRRVAFSLSDPFCVDRHRAEFLALLEGDVDVLFANEAEAVSLFEVASLEDAVVAVQGRCEVAVITCGPAGSIVVGADGARFDVPAAPVPGGRVVDTTGAGDLYAAGFLHGLTTAAAGAAADLAACARLGALAAAEVISHIGARPQTPLRFIAE